MRIAIKSTDRLGISQEILTVFANKSWDLCAIEVVTGFTYVNIDEAKICLSDVKESLAHVKGIILCEEVDLLPTESRERHLKALLNRLPEPILDIDQHGVIVAMNCAAEELFADNHMVNTTLHVENLLGIKLTQIFTDKPIAITIEIKEHSYVADITPVVSESTITGAVITLTTMGAIGRQLSIMQSPEQQGVEGIIGCSVKIKSLLEQTLRFAELDLPVLIDGETGTGKELIARTLHNAGRRSKAPFLAVNCAALPEHLLESELFGYASGAFTGAKKGGKPGLFELAEGGTVFLDEIAEMSIYLQAKLLRFLQDYSYRRVGGTTEMTANVRIISATHQNLVGLFEEQNFRDDLYYRLNVLSLSLPALRERQEDIPLLTEHFMHLASIQVNQPQVKMSQQGMQILQGYSWPGNIRQLQNVLFRLVALNGTGEIQRDAIEQVLSEFAMKTKQVDNLSSTEHIEDWSSAQAKFERQLLSGLYPHYPTTRKLAKRLNVSHNKVAMKLREHGLSD